MKPNNQTSENDEPLRTILREWVVDAPLPARFQEQVWQRIERADAQPKNALWPVLLRLADALLPRPKLAFAYAAVLLAAGIAAGSWTAQIQSSRLDAALGSRYILSVDPYKTVALSR
jgi:ABC-type dipeptide/oligopeptide/nickel transport system permease component